MYIGFYVSRYEVGKETINGKNVPVSKRNADVWTSISISECKSNLKEFINNSNVKSAFISGTQYDVIMGFVNGKKDGLGEEFDIDTPNIKRHTGSLAKSGQNENDKVCNIYDLEGNCQEYVAEKCPSYGANAYVYRGSFYSQTDWYNGACRRFSLCNGGSYPRIASRMVLYVSK